MMPATTNTDEGDFLTIEQFAARARISASTIRRMMSRGEVDYVYFGNLLRFPPSVLDAAGLANRGGRIVHVRG